LLFLLFSVYAQSSTYTKQGLIVVDESPVGFSYYKGPLQYIPEDDLVKEKESEAVGDDPSAQECFKNCERCLCDEDYWVPDCYYCEYCAENYVWECCDHCGGRPPKPPKPQPPKPHPPKPDEDDEDEQISQINIHISNDCHCNYDDVNNYNLTALCTQDNDPILSQNQSVPLNLNNTFEAPISVSTSAMNSGTFNLFGAVEGLLNGADNASLGTCLIGCPIIAANCYGNIQTLVGSCVGDPVVCLPLIIASFETCSTELTICLTRACGVAPLVAASLDTNNAGLHKDVQMRSDDEIFDAEQADNYDDDDEYDDGYKGSKGEEYIKFMIEDDEDAYDAITKELMRFIIEKYIKKQ